MTRKLAVGGGAVVAVVAAYAAWTQSRVGGDAATVAVEDYGQALAALAAAAACSVAAIRSMGRTRLGWALFALSAASWAAGELVWAVNEVNLGHAVPFPSAADAGYLAAIPLAAAAVIAFPFGPSTNMGRLRAVLDGIIVSTSLIYVAWDLGLGGMESQARVGVLGGLLVVAYPAGDILLLGLLGMSTLRARPVFRPVIGTLMAVFIAALIADSGYAYLILHGGYGMLGSVSDAGWIAGFLLLGLASIQPVPAAEKTAGEDTVEIWQLAMPWVAVSGVIATSAWVAVSGRQTGVDAALIGTIMGVFFLSSQILTLNDALRLLVRSRKAESQLKERTALLAEVIGRAPLGIARVNDQFRFIDVNPMLCQLLAAPSQTLLGASMRAFLSEEEVAAAEKRMARMRTGELTHVDVDSEMLCADGRKVFVHRSITPVMDGAGRVEYYLIMFEDTTTKHEAEQAAIANLATLERLNRLKSEFMSMVSHEFRTALTGIQGYSEVLNTDEVAPDEVKEFAGDINSEAQRLNRMITEMLDMDRIESGRIQLHLEPVDLNRLVAGMTERAQMGTTKHTIKSHLDPLVGRIEGDADRLTQVVSNLLSNAVKYSPAGGEIVVSTRVDGGGVEVSVRDHGQGIPPEFLQKIFGRYERYEGAGRAQVVGTGLGLAIAQQIIQLHKGRIWVESAVGEGSTFRFVIPVAAAPSKVA